MISADCSQCCLKTIAADENKPTEETDTNRFSSVVNDCSVYTSIILDIACQAKLLPSVLGYPVPGYRQMESGNEKMSLRSGIEQL